MKFSMKFSSKIVALLAFVILGFSVQSCQKDDVLSPSDELAYAIATPDELVEVEVTDGTVDTDPILAITSANGDIERRQDRKGACKPRGHKNPIKFEGAFRQLGLSDDQKNAIKALLKSHKDCLVSAREAFLAANEEALAAAKTARQAIVAEVKAGTITRDEAKEAIKAVNQTLRESIEANGSREETKAALQACFDSFDASIEAILTPDQLAKWNAFKANRPKRM